MNNLSKKQPLAVKIIGGAALIGVSLLSVVHGILTRTLSEYSIVIIWVLSVSSFLALIMGITSWFRTKSIELVKFIFVVLGILVFSLTIISPVFYSIGVSILDLLRWVSSPRIPTKETVPFTIFFTLFIGIILFYFRLYLRSLYGISEILVGLTVAGTRVIAESQAVIIEPKFYLTLLTAGIYLVVRGLDNLHQGFTKPPLDAFALKLFRAIDRLKELNQYLNNKYGS